MPGRCWNANGHNGAVKAENGTQINADKRGAARSENTMRKRTAHPGFKAVARAIARRQGISIQAASRILAKKTRQASPAAKARNPRLLRVR